MYIVQNKRKIANIFSIEPITHIKDKKIVTIFVKFKFKSSLKINVFPNNASVFISSWSYF